MPSSSRLEISNMNLKLKTLIRFLVKIDDTYDSCWRWTSTISKAGYPYFTLTSTKMVRAHRLSYMIFKGDIPNGLVLDHLCRNKSCVNPDHLEAVTSLVNTRRGLSGKINNPQTKKTNCPKGHSLSDNNLTLYTKRLGYRRCLICSREYQKLYQRQLRLKKKIEAK